MSDEALLNTSGGFAEASFWLHLWSNYSLRNDSAAETLTLSSFQTDAEFKG